MFSVQDLIRKYSTNVTECKAEGSFRAGRPAGGVCIINEQREKPLSPQGTSKHLQIGVRIDNALRLKKADLPFDLSDLLKKTLTFDNPQFLRQQRFGQFPPKAQRHLFGIWEEGDDLVLSRGFKRELIRIFHANRLPFSITDKTRQFAKVDFNFSGDLNGNQAEAARAAAQHQFGIVLGRPASGKKVLALKLICDRRLPALVIVRSKSRLYQWRNTADRFLGLKGPDIGLIGDGSKRLGGKLTIAIDRTLYRMIDELKEIIGFIIVDQCHTANLKIFTRAISSFDCSFMLGLSNSVERPDGLTKLMMAYIGPLLAEIRPAETLDGLEGSRPHAIIRRTGFVFNYREDYGELVSALCADQRRNQLITTDILQETAARNRLSLVLSERIDQLSILRQQLAASYVNSELLTSLTPVGKKREILNSIERRKLPVVLVTAKGIHDITAHAFDALFLASPLRLGDHLMQILGKLQANNNRSRSGIIYDYLDEPGVLKASLNRRMKAYRSIGSAIMR
jgi:hypothetical protein